ncbi:glucosamine-6-phosphate deaminase [Atopobacter sp. AH10]|uniref:glucosamine-6-phosphate deaminase n=1 Tax=Atopobacter sp. AH10 TaxID=2315861 RepID=UPI000EF1DA47|nr:glucosamine-6-phosphate deaminase [Atopobacter sp. AH10]RLK64284.1 glucosamine-6-phosphate deaminase [Atopobacter sp. AH10]
MELIIVSNKAEGSKKAFEQIIAAKNSGAKVFGLATGSTPEGVYQLLRESDVDFSDCVSVNLDEYVGLAPDNPQSYHYFMKKHLFDDKPFKASYLPDGLSDDPSSYEEILAAHPIDLQILGIGNNGHIAFNEPGTAFDSRTHKVSLTESTIQANKRFFEKEEDVPRYAYTMGLASIMSAKSIILMAFGEAKQDAIYSLFNDQASTDIPATILQNHPDVTVIVDKAAAAKLTNV